MATDGSGAARISVAGAGTAGEVRQEAVAGGRERDVPPELLRAELRRTLAETSARGAVFNLPGALVVVLLVAPVTGSLVLWGWAALLSVVSILRILFCILALRRKQTDRRWFEPLTAFFAGISGLCWGSVPYLFALPRDSTELTVLTLVGGGVVLTGALTFAPSRLSLAAFSIPVLVAQFVFNLGHEPIASSWLGIAVATLILYAWAASRAGR